MKYSDSKELDEKLTKQCGDDKDRYFEKVDIVREIENKTTEFLEMFRENYMGEDDTKSEVFARELVGERRTHQQSIVRNLYSALKKYVELGGSWADARNESAMAWCKKVTSEPEYFPFV